ncbi:MAG: transporter substrate-binding domain-containing protein [Desulfobacterales bacterium]|nr:transporter substrate-binding domain-containing protein [Desulfobacterales bacterium]
MKPIRIGLTVLLVALLMAAPTVAQTLVLATDDTPGDPYIMGGGTGFHPTLPGIEIELYQMVARQMDLTVTFLRLPWKRCLQELKYGRVDGVFPASYKPEREAIGIYPMKDGRPDFARSTRDGAYHLYRPRGSKLLWNGTAFELLEDSAREAIGVPLGWAIAGDLKQMGIQILERADPKDLLNMLAAGGLAGVVCLDTVIDAYLRETPRAWTSIEKVDPPILEKPYYLVFSLQFEAKYPGLPEKIWDRIATIKGSEPYGKIIDRYTRQ